MARRNPPARLSGILLISEQKIATVRLVEQVLESYCSSTGIRFDSRIVANVTPESFGRGVLPIFCRTSDEMSFEWMCELEAQGWPFLYYIDDDFWAIDKAHPLGRFYGRPFVRKALAHSITHSRLTMASTTYLAGKLARFRADIRVMTPHVHPYLLAGGARSSGSTHPATVRIGFASNVSRLSDLNFLLPTLERLLLAHPDWEADFIGVKPEFTTDLPNVTFLQYQEDYQSYVDLIRDREWDIVLSPLLDSESARSKTNNKYREFAALGVPGVFSRVGAYAEVVDGELGIVVDNTPEGWEAGISRLATNASLRRHISVTAHRDAESKYALARVVDEWAEVINTVAPEVPADERTIPMPHIHGHYAHVIQDLFYEAFVLTRVFGPKRGLGFFFRQSSRLLHRAWETKILARFYPNALTRVWVGDFTRVDRERLASHGYRKSGKRVRTLRKAALFDPAADLASVPWDGEGVEPTVGFFARLQPTSLVAALTITVRRGQKIIDTHLRSLRPQETFELVEIPRPPRGATLEFSIPDNDDAAPSDVVVIIESRSRELLLIAGEVDSATSA